MIESVDNYSIADYTLWPFWVDTHVNPPFHKNGYVFYLNGRRYAFSYCLNRKWFSSNGKIVDCRGSVIKHYPDTPKVLKCLWENDIGISVASRTGEIDGAEQLVNLFGWNKYFTNKQIYPGSKDIHINRQVHIIFLYFMYIFYINNMIIAIWLL